MSATLRLYDPALIDSAQPTPAAPAAKTLPEVAPMDAHGQLWFPGTLPAPSPQTGADVPAITIGQVIALYLERLQQAHEALGKPSKVHLVNVRSRLRPFIADFGAKPITEAKLQHQFVNWFLKQCGTRWKSNWSRKGALQAILQCFEWAAEQDDLIAKSPFKRAKEFDFPEPETGQPVSDEAWLKMCVQYPPAFADVRDVLYGCALMGTRPQETYTLTVAQVDLKNREIVWTKHKTDSTGRKVLPITALLRELLDRLFAARDAQARMRPQLFLTEKGKPWQPRNFYRQFDKLRTAVGLATSVKPYDFRHGLATDLNAAGSSEATTGEALGHAKGSKITRHYIHPDQELVRQAIERAHELRMARIARLLPKPDAASGSA